MRPSTNHRSLTVFVTWPIQVVLWLSSALLMIITISLWTESAIWLRVVFCASTLLLIYSCLGFVIYRVKIRDSDFIARSLFGWPSLKISFTDIREIKIVKVNPLCDFLGWGYRMRSFRDKGIITQGGDALEITGKDGSKITVTTRHASALRDDIQARLA